MFQHELNFKKYLAAVQVKRRTRFCWPRHCPQWMTATIAWMHCVMSNGWDRTEEFLQLTQLHTAPERTQGSSVKLRQPHPQHRHDVAESSAGPIEEETQFSKDSAAIGRELGVAGRKIAELQKRKPKSSNIMSSFNLSQLFDIGASSRIALLRFKL